MTAEKRMCYVREAGSAMVVGGILVALLAVGVSQASETVAIDQPDKWVDALAEARSVQRLMAYAIVALSVALAGLGGYLIRLLSGIIRENTAELRMCRDRQEHHRGRE